MPPWEKSFPNWRRPIFFPGKKRACCDNQRRLYLASNFFCGKTVGCEGGTGDVTQGFQFYGFFSLLLQCVGTVKGNGSSSLIEEQKKKTTPRVHFGTKFNKKIPFAKHTVWHIVMMRVGISKKNPPLFVQTRQHKTPSNVVFLASFFELGGEEIVYCRRTPHFFSFFSGQQKRLLSSSLAFKERSVP